MKKITLLLFTTILFVALKSNAQCDAPTGLTVSYANNVTTFSWNPVSTATEYFFDIDWAGGTWGLGEDVAPANTYSITGLMQGGNFQWRVRTNCNGIYSSYTTAFYSSACLSPFNLSTTNITANSGILNWEQSTTVNNNNTGFSVSYRLANTNNSWIQLTNIYNNPTATFFNLTGLTANTTYEWRVRRACSFSNSDYVYSQFTTAPPPIVYCISSGINLTNCGGGLVANWINYFKLGTINRTSVSEPGGYANIPMSTDLVIGSTNNAGQISVGFSGSVTNSRFMVWIDFNRNGSFLDAGERLLVNTAAASITGTTVKNFSINIPSNVTAGITRMRIFSIKNAGNVTNPCLTGYLGETEDYTVNLVASSLRAANNSNDISIVTKQEVENTVFPNPSNGIYNISISKIADAVSYDVLNASGTVVQKNKITNAKIFKIDISNMPSGLYLLRINNLMGKPIIYKLQKTN